MRPGIEKPTAVAAGKLCHYIRMPEKEVPRRAFLRGAAAATALSYSRVYGANERVQLGLIGCGERGRYDMGLSLIHI